MVKQRWAYFGDHNLQDPEDRRKIIWDDALRNLLGTNSTDMFKMNKLLSRHIWPLDNGVTEAAGKNCCMAFKCNHVLVKFCNFLVSFPHLHYQYVLFSYFFLSLCAAKVRDRDTDTDDVEPKPKKQKTVSSGGGKSKTQGFLAPYPISDQLAKFLDVEDGKVSRAEAAKRMWAYIKDHNLQVSGLA